MEDRIVDYSGDALDLSVAAGGVFSMRRHQGSLIRVATVGADGVLTLNPDEALQVAESLLAAVRSAREEAAGTRTRAA